MLSKTLFAQPGCGVNDARDITDTLSDFAKHAVALRTRLYQGGTFNEAEFLFIENHLQTLEMAHLWWKRKQGRVHAPNSQESMDRSFTGN